MINKPVKWLSAWQIAEMLNIHMNTVKRIPPKDLPYIRVVRRGDRRYKVEDVNKYIEERTVNGSRR